MNNIFRIRRRISGNPGAPSSLKNAELAFNEIDEILYYGKGVGAGDNATGVVPIAGPGVVVMRSGDQIIEGEKEFDRSPLVPTAAAGDNTSKAASTAFVAAAVLAGSIPDGNKGDLTVSGSGSNWTINDAAVSLAKLAPIPTKTFVGRVASGTGAPSALTATQVKSALSLSKTDVGLGNVDNTSDAAKPISTATATALAGKAPLASPSLTGTPTAPTAPKGTQTQQIATTAFVHTELSEIIGGAPEALDTLHELAEALGDDPNFAATITSSLAEKSRKDANLSDLASVSAARTNLGLQGLALQAPNSVDITGGSVAGVSVSDTVIDCGTF